MPQYDDPLWTILVFAIIILAAIWAKVYNKVGGAPYEADAGTDEKYNIAAVDIMQAAQLGRVDSLYKIEKPPTQTHDSAKTEQDVVRAIKPIEWWTGILAVATVLAAIFAGFTLSAIRGQLNEMRAEQRPWVSVGNAAVASDFIFDGGGAKLAISFYLCNTGHLPARDVGINAVIVPFFNKKSAPNCSPPPCDKQFGGHFVVFPNGDLSMEETISVTKYVMDCANSMWRHGDKSSRYMSLGGGNLHSILRDV